MTDFEKMTAKEVLEIYKGRDASEKLFLSDKTVLKTNPAHVLQISHFYQKQLKMH